MCLYDKVKNKEACEQRQELRENVATLSILATSIIANMDPSVVKSDNGEEACQRIAKPQNHG